MPLNLWFPPKLLLGNFVLSSYALFVVLGVGIFLSSFFGNAKRLQLAKPSLLSFLVIALVGGHLLGALIMQLITGDMGSSFYASALGATVVAGAYGLWVKLPLLRIADRTTPSLALGFAFMKLGCLITGCCFGSPTDGYLFALYTKTAHHTPHVIRVHSGWENLALHPTQLWVTLLALGIFLLTRFLSSRLEKQGSLFLLALTMYVLGRSVIDSLTAAADFSGAIEFNHYMGALLLVGAFVARWGLIQRETAHA